MATNHDQDGGGPHEDETDEKNEKGRFVADVLTVEEPRILVGDVISILLTAQLLGLADVLSDPSFWSDGGFLQPVGMPSTLPTLVRRDSEMSIAWVLAALKNSGYSLSAVADDSSAIKCAVSIWVDYCSLRIVYALGTAFAAHVPVNGWDLMRQCWFTVLMLCTFRIIYSQNNR